MDKQGKQRKWLRCMRIFLGFVLLFTGCTAPATPATVPEETMPPEDTGPIPSLRTGIATQGTYVVENAFECTEDGIYVMCEYLYDTFLLYADHGSDTFVKLCGRPDCDHTGEDCNAHFYYCHNICYYDGYLYAVEVAGSRARLYRMNPDGTDRVSLVTSTDVGDVGGYSSLFGPLVCNGVFLFHLTDVNEDGETVAKSFYYRLDGSMEKPEPMNISSVIAFSDGENIMAYGEAKSGTGDLSGIYQWDPETNTSIYLADIPEDSMYDYWGAETGYYFKDGIIYQLHYADGSSEALFDTGLEGFYQMSCFPDCIVLAKACTQEERMTGKQIEDQVLYIYDWDFQLQGQVEIDYPMEISGEYVLCGETPDRLLLAARVFGVPEYYIEKSDFGTGNMEIRPFNLPELPGMGDETETDEQG